MWMVALITIAVLLAALLIWRIVARSSRKVEPPAPMVERFATALPETPKIPFYLEMSFDQGGPPEHVQIARPNRPEFIGTQAFPGMGKGMPARYAEVAWRAGSFYLRPLSWQMPVRVREVSGAEYEIPAGRNSPIHDGTVLRLEGGWTVMCRVREDKEE